MRLAVGLALILTLSSCKLGPNWVLSPPKQLGPPLRSGDRLYILTSQFNSRIDYSMDSFQPQVKDTDLFTDLWALDVRTAAPLWRKRLRTERNAPMEHQEMLGAEGDVLWLLLHQGLTAVSAAAGDVVADANSVQARNASLK